eukprot:15481239-Alexandrium_andersonii.AAC.1
MAPAAGGSHEYIVDSDAVARPVSNFAQGVRVGSCVNRSRPRGALSQQVRRRAAQARHDGRNVLAAGALQSGRLPRGERERRR